MKRRETAEMKGGREERKTYTYQHRRYIEDLKGGREESKNDVNPLC